MSIKRKIADALIDFNTYRVEQKVRIKAMLEKLDVTHAELHVHRLSASMRFCKELRATLRKGNQVVEVELLKLAELQKANPEAMMTAEALIAVMEAIDKIEQTIARKDEIPKIVSREGKHQLRLKRALDVLLGNRALLTDMIERVERDSVRHATMDLITRLHEINTTIKYLPVGFRFKEILDYELAFKNIGIFVRAVKNTHKIFCKVYPM